MKCIVYVVLRIPQGNEQDGDNGIVRGVYASEREAYEAIDDCYIESYQDEVRTPSERIGYTVDMYINDHPGEYILEETILEI